MEEGCVGVSVLLPREEALLPSPVSTGETFSFDGAELELKQSHPRLDERNIPSCWGGVGSEAMETPSTFVALNTCVMELKEWRGLM